MSRPIERADRDRILELLNAEPEKLWSPAAVLEQLNQAELNRDQVRQRLRRMLQAGEIARPVPGYYKANPENP